MQKYEVMLKNGKWIAFIFILITIHFFYSGKSLPTKNQEQTATKDFSWLKTYGAIYYTFSQEQWENNTGRTFDSNGVHLTNGKYHPVNACHYALFCFDEFKKTGKDVYKKAFLAQCSYLLDPTKYDAIGDDKIAYPYKIAFHDLKPTWYSALAQSEAISTLIRYYSLTKDEKALGVIIKLKNFMVAPQTEKGTMSCTPEGNVWLEEYPNSTQERQVLNGFFLGLVALYEYSHLFPSDQEVQDLYEQCLHSAKESVKFYDTGLWLMYNRGDKRLVANGYMKWQVNEMRQLYELTGDEFFKHQFMVWITYAYNKEYVTPGCKVSYYNWALPAVVDANGWLQTIPVKVRSIVADDVNAAVLYPEQKNLKNLVDNTTMVWRIATNDTMKNAPNFNFSLKSPKNLTEMNITTVDSLNDKIVSVTYRENVSDRKMSRLKIKNITKINGGYNIAFAKLVVSEMRITFDVPKGKSIGIKGFSFYNEGKPGDNPSYAFYKGSITKVEKPDMKVNIAAKDVTELYLLYRTGTDSLNTNKNTWQTKNTITKSQGEIVLDENEKYFQYLLVYKKDLPGGSVRLPEIN